MDEREFRRLLDLFPVVRSRNFCAGSELLRGSTSHSTRDERAQGEGGLNEVVSKDGSTEIANDDLFWQKLWVAAEKKVGATKAEKFCEAFRKAHERLVYKELSLDAVRKFVN